ncbi:MAG TPA: Na+:solute symporter [Paludibacteraceae bacterium]|nr:Na+:solute symporter [Paludibacteraceae bacterium]
MHYLDYVSILVFTLLVLITGSAFAKAGGKDMKSFFAAGGAIPWWMSSLSLFMGFFSAGTFVVWGSIAYSSGMVALSIQWTMAMAGFIVGFVIAPRWHKTHSLTAAEFITHRLSPNVQRIYTYIFLFISLFSSGAFLYPVAKIVSVATDFNLYYCILILGIVSIIYVSLGGLWAVVVTDVLQFIILVSSVIIVIPLAFDKIGGVDNFFGQLPEGFLNLTNQEYTLGFILAFGFYNLIFLGGNWAYVQRYTSVKTHRDAKKVGWMFGFLYIISPILWMLPPMIYRIYNPSLMGLENEGAYLLMCKMALPVGMLGMMLGGMVFATASSLNATLNISSGVFTNDIYRRIRPNKTDQELIKVARFSTIGFGVLGVIVAMLIPSMGGIVNVVITLGALTGVPLYLPIIWTLFSKRQNARSVITVTLISLLVNALLKFVVPLFGFSLNRTEETVIGVSLPVILLTLYEIYYKVKNRVDPKYLEYAKREKERRILRELESTKEQLANEKKSNQYSIMVMGNAIAASGVITGIIGILASSGKYVILPIAVLLIILGLGLRINNKKDRNN